MLTFLAADVDINLALDGSYDYGLVALSYAIACAAAFTAWNLADQVKVTKGGIRLLWLWGGATALGVGVWSMHFIGMLSFVLPIPVSYDPLITLLSMLPAILAGAVVIAEISRTQLRTLALCRSGALMGAGIGAMHYTGMAAMNMNAQMAYEPWRFYLSLAIAVVLATAALFSRFLVLGYRSHERAAAIRWGGILMMGLAIAGMHYTAMTSVYFFPSLMERQLPTGLPPHLLSTWVSVATISLLLVAVATSYIANRLHAAEVEFQAHSLANQLKNDFLSKLTHELLTPINGLHVSLALLKPYISKDGMSFFSTAQSSNYHLQGLIESLILFTESRRHDLVLNPSIWDITEHITLIFNRVERSVENKGVLNIDKKFPRYAILDFRKLALIIFHLLKNSNDFTDNGTVSLSVKVIDINDSIDKLLSIQVEDTGTGISPDMQRVINDFFSGESDNTAYYESSLGLGYGLIKPVLSALGGELNFKPVDAGGTCVSIQLPVLLPSTEQIKNFTRFHDFNAASKSVPIKVLVVEDNDVNMMLIVKLLKSLNYAALSAKNGALALEVLKHHNDIAIVLMDCHMPVMDGYESTREIRNMKLHRDTPIIAVTANTSAEDRLKCVEAGMNDFMSKPINKKAVNAMLGKWLNRDSCAVDL